MEVEKAHVFKKMAREDYSLQYLFYDLIFTSLF